LAINPIQIIPSISGGNNCGIWKGSEMTTNLDYQTTLNLKKAGRYTDSFTKGLQLLIKPSGTKYWLLRFAFNGKRHELGIGSFPDLKPKDARLIAQEARTEIAKGQNLLHGLGRLHLE
jgi:hypothetical protein